MSQVLYRGVEWRRRITILEDGAAKNLSSLTVLLQLRRRTGAAVLIQLSVGAGITLAAQSGVTLGMADVVLSGASSPALALGGHVITVLVDGQVALRPTKLTVADL